MQLMLSDDEARTLHNTLRDYLPDLKREAAAVELPARELRQEYGKRVALVERLLADLERAASSAPGQT